MTDAERRIFAWRRWYGIGPDGRKVEEWTQKKIAAHLGVSERTVRRWVKEEPAPVFERLTRRQRLILYSMAVAGKVEKAREYLLLLSLDRTLSGRRDGSPVKSPGADGAKSDSRNASVGGRGLPSEQSTAPDSDPHPFDGLSEDFDPW
jgi:hypothetical protein